MYCAPYVESYTGGDYSVATDPSEPPPMVKKLRVVFWEARERH